jgi:hypothetical protein
MLVPLFVGAGSALSENTLPSSRVLVAKRASSGRNEWLVASPDGCMTALRLC